MKQSRISKSKPGKIEIVKNKEIIIYKDGKEFKRFNFTESEEYTEDQLYLVDRLIKNYSGLETGTPSKKQLTEEEQRQLFENDEFFRDSFNESKTKSKFNVSNTISSANKSHKFKTCNCVNDNENDEFKQTKKTVTRTTKLVNPENYNEQKIIKNYQYEEEDDDENVPQYVIEVESYTSPTFKDVDEQKAENAILKGVPCSMMILGKEEKGLLFLGANENLIFSAFNDGKNFEIDLNEIVRIYFNIRGSENLRNYNKKSNEERFIEIVEPHCKATDFKFNNQNDLELFVKGVGRCFRNNVRGVEKSAVNTRVLKSQKNYVGSNDYDQEKEYQERDYQEREYQEKEYEYEPEMNTYSKEYRTVEVSKGNDNYYDDNYMFNDENLANNNSGELITTKTEVFKNGKLVSEETKEELDGVAKSLHAYCPDVEEYNNYLRKSKLRKSGDYVIGGLHTIDSSNLRFSNVEDTGNQFEEKCVKTSKRTVMKQGRYKK